MKKKIAVLGMLLLAVVVTTYSVSGTYAKYTTKLTEQTDSARVAKWNIAQNTNIEDLFKSSYPASDDATANAVLSTVDVVAPGTNGEYKFKLSGTTETNYTLAVSVAAEDTINTTTYAPIVYKLDNNAVTDLDSDGVVTAKDLAKAIENLYPSNKIYAAGNVDETEHTISWEWAFNGYADGATDEQIAEADAKDTALGNAIATDADSHKVSLKVNITATQSENKAN